MPPHGRVFAHPESVKLWVEAAKGRPDWEAIFAGYRSVVDYPGAQFWRELTAYYSNAKVVHTVRDPDEWFDSVQATIFAPGSRARQPGPMSEFFRIVLGPFGDRIDDRAYMTDYFRKHTRDVLATIPADRVLVYEVRQGWGPLCSFLGVPVPSEPFPVKNSRAEFIDRVQAGLLGAPP